MGGRRGLYRAFLGTPERNRTLERPKHRWDDNIDMQHQEVRGTDIDWIGLAQDRDRWRKVVCTLMKYRFLGPSLLAGELLAFQEDCSPWSR